MGAGYDGGGGGTPWVGAFWMKGGFDGQTGRADCEWRWKVASKQAVKADFRGRVFGGEGGGVVWGGTDVGIRSDWKGWGRGWRGGWRREEERMR